MLRRKFLQTSGALAAAGITTPGSWLQAQTTRAGDETFIDTLLARMTLEEKAGQLSIFYDNSREEAPNVNPAEVLRTREQIRAEIAAGRVGGLFNGLGVASGIELQRVAIEQSRLKIPLIFAADIIHGLRTIFPVPLAEAAAFDTQLAERTARAAALEATALGVQWTFAPMVDMARDQRWGRVVEGAGEDTYLGRLLAAARVRGFQGRDLRHPDSMLTTMKHFVGYGAVTGGMEYNSVEVSTATLHDVHLPPFKAGIDAGALSVMTAFHDINGVPATAHRPLLTGLLREQWGFRGLVVSDYASEKELVDHGYAVDEKDAARLALLAGCDMSMASGIYNRYLPALVREGAIPMAVLDESVRRVLRVKQALGLFDNPYRSLDLHKEKTALRQPQTIALAREAARRSVVLLKNEQSLLPLPKTGKRLALIGPFVRDRAHIMGPWALWWQPDTGVSLEQGLREALGDPGSLLVVPGCDIEAPLDGGIAAAVAAAQQADVAILYVGEGDYLSGESAARTDIGLPSAQQALVDAVVAVGKPTVLVLQHGRALALTGSTRQATAIVAAWYLGCESGHALADILLGDHSPSGRLPVSFPQASGQQPYFYNHRSTGRPQVRADDAQFKTRYRDITHEALYPFGYGLSYSPVTYGKTELSAADLPWHGAVEVSATLANLGQRAVREVVQLYIHQRVGTLTRPVRELRGFKSVALQAGQRTRVSFSLTRQDLAYAGPDGAALTEPGWFDIYVAPHAAGGVPRALRLLKAE